MATKGQTAPRQGTATGKLVYTVRCTADEDEIGMETLVGDYVESGMNHGKKFFKRKPSPGPDDVTVFLYYWDARDGAEFSGWWFGDQVGGSQVWSRCDKPASLPPRAGWRIPWDGQVRTELIVEPPAVANKKPPTKAKVEAKEELKDDASGVAPAREATALDERAQRSTDRVVIAESDATQALDSARAMLEGEVNEEDARVVEELLQAQQTAITEAHKVLAADIMVARKKSPGTVGALQKLTPRLRSVQASIAREVQEAKRLIAKKKAEQDEKSREAEVEAKQVEAEHSDVKKLESMLPAVLEVVSKAEDSLDGVVAAASSLNAEFGEDMSESVSAALRETESLVEKTQAMIQAARKHVAQETNTARQFAPAARKVAITEFSSLQERLSDAGKKLAPYLRVRKDYEQKLDAKNILTEVTTKLGSVEAEVEKVVGVLAEPNKNEERIKAAEAALVPVMKSLANAMKFVDQRMQNAKGTVKADLTQMQERGLASKKKLEEFHMKLRGQSEQVQLQMMLRRALEKTEKAEELLQEAVIAEEPFLKGLELIPGPEVLEAISKAEKTIQAAEAAAIQASTFLKTSAKAKVAEGPEATKSATSEELMQLESRVEVAAQQVASMKRETAMRKTTVLLHEVAKKVTDSDAKVKMALAMAEPLLDQKLEEVGMGKLKEAANRTLEAEKVAAVTIVDAKKALIAKQKAAASAADAPPSFANELAKLQAKLSAAQLELAKQRKAALMGEKMWKLLQERETLREVGTEVDRAEILTTPLGNERPTEDTVAEMVAAVDAVQQRLSVSMKSLESSKGVAQGDFKALLDTLLERAKGYQEKIDEMNAVTRETREQTQCESLLKDCRAQLVKIEDAFKKAAEAETPYLKGNELLPLHVAVRAIEDSEAIAKTVQQLVIETRALLTSKSLVVRKLMPDVARRGLQEIGELSAKNELSIEKLAAFKRDTEGRKKIMLQQQAAAKVSEAEEAVQKTILAATPLASQNLDEISSEVATKICERLAETEREAQTNLEEARAMLNERQRDTKGRPGATEVAELMARLNNLQVDLAKAKTTASEHEQKFVAKMLLHEASEMFAKVEAEHAKAIEEAKPLTEQKGSTFVVASMARTVFGALGEYLSQKGQKPDDLLKKMKATDGKVSETAFTSFLETLPTLLSRAELDFTQEHRSAIFAQCGGSKPGELSKEEFARLFHERYICTSGVSITEKFDLEEGGSTGRIETDDIVEAFGEPRSHDTLGIMRVEVRAIKDGTTGWATLKGNQGTTYLVPFSPYAAFAKQLDKVIGSARGSTVSLAGFVNTRTAELRDCSQGPLAEAKAELMKIRPKVSAVQAKLELLRRQVDEGKREHAKREEAERKSQEEKKDRQAARLVTQGMAEKLENAQAKLAQLKDTTHPLVSLGEAELGSFEKPLTTLEAVEAAARAASGAFSEAREYLKAHEGNTMKLASGPWLAARQELTRLKEKVDSAEKEATAFSSQAHNARDSLAAAKLGQVAAALRTSLLKRGIAADALYEELAGKGDCIPEAAFGKYLDTLPDVKLPTEQKKLLVTYQQGGFKGDVAVVEGLTRWGFLRMLQRFSKVVKEIAITTDFDIKNSSTTRKLEVAELIELLEEPKTDAALGLTRVRARALADETMGWVTVKGSQGTPFLQDAQKPYLVTAEELPLQDGFPSEGCTDVAKMRPHEVLEVLEGPRKESVGNPVRAYGKASRDGAVGWFTVLSRQGQECAKAGQTSYTCRAPIALTSGLDIQTCEVLRKLDRGEILTGLEEPKEDAESGTFRIKAKAAKDGTEGWVTLKGNAGTVYVAETNRRYTVTKTIPLQKTFQADSEQVRNLEEGEELVMLEGPKEEQSEPVVRIKVRTTSSGKVGWATLRQRVLRKWVPSYRCVGATNLDDRPMAKGAQAVRTLEVGEPLELIDGPKDDAALGALRLKVRAKKDGVVGWVTATDSKGKMLVACGSAA